MVGTHRAPNGKEGEVTNNDMQAIHKALEERFLRESDDICNNLRFVQPEVMFAAVESSIDSEYKREESGATLVQKAIQEAWKELPFKDEEYPTTWLRFEAFLNQNHAKCIVGADRVQQRAKDCGIGIEDEKEIEDALSFFHDIGTIVYLSKH